MDSNKSQKTTENDLLDEFDISSISSAIGMDKKDEEIRKLKAKLQQIKNAANSNQFGGLFMMQIGEKFGKIENVIDGLKSANRVEIRAFEELKKEIEKMAEENAGLREKMAKMNEKFAEKNGEMEKMKAEMQGLAKENEDSKQKVGKLAQDNSEMKEEMGKMKAAKDEEKAKLEALKEEVSKMKTQFDGKIIEFEGKMLKSLEQKEDKKEFVHNKWNGADCGPKLATSGKGGLVVKHLGGKRWNCIRAISPIPSFNLNAAKPSIADYFEVQIVSKNSKLVGSIQIGFCTRQFPREGKWLGNFKNSIEIWHKGGMHINGQFKEFGNGGGESFKVGHVIGVGIIHFPANKPMKCFSTLNGQLLGTLELPANFATLQLFPATTLLDNGDSIVANFGQKKWRYDPSQLLK